MANDIDIRVRVANQSGAGLGSVTESLNRLRSSANDANSSVTALRASLASDMTISAHLDNQTEADIAAIKTAVRELEASSPVRLRAEFDNRTEAGTTAVRTAIRALKALSPIRLRAEFLNRTEAGITATRAAVRELEASSPIRLEAEFRGDTAQIVGSARAMRDLRSDASRAGTALTSLTTRATAAAAALTLLQEAAQGASQALRTLRGRVAATADAMGDLRDRTTVASSSLRTMSTRLGSADGRMEALSTRTAALRDNMNSLDGAVRGVGNGLQGLRGSLGSVRTASNSAHGSQQRLLAVALALAPALIPIAAAAVPVAASLGAAGVAVAVFGAALIPQIKALREASAAQRKYTEASEQYGQASKQTAQAEKDYLQQMGSLPPATREAAAGLSVLKDQYKEWAAGLANPTMSVATKSFALFGALFPKLTPVVQAASQELNRFETIVAGGIESASFDRFMDNFAVFVGETLAKANSALVRLTTNLSDGEAGEGGLAKFMQFARDNGPVVAETLGNLGRAVGRLLVAASETGIGLLSLANAFAALINAIPPEVLSRLVQLAVAFKLVRLAAAGLTVVGPQLADAAIGIQAFSRSARLNGVASAIQGVTQSLTAMQKSVIVLAAIAAVVITINELADAAKGAPPSVDKLAASLKQLGEAGRFTGELKKTFGDMDGFVKRVQQLRDESEKLEKVRPPVALAALGPLGVSIAAIGPWAEDAVKKIDSLVRGSKGLASAQEDVKAFDEAFASLATSGHADEAARQFDRFQQALMASGMSAQQVAAMFPQYQAAVQTLNAEQEIAARSMGLFGEQAVSVQQKLNAQKQSADGLRQSLQALNDVNRIAMGGMIGFEAAIDAAAKAASDNAGSLRMVNGTLDLNSEKARTSASALADLAAKTDEAASSARDNGASWSVVNGIFERGREKLIGAAQQMGLTRDQARLLAEQILRTPDKTAQLKGNMDDLRSKLEDAKRRLASVPDSRKAEVRAEIGQLTAAIRRAENQLSSMQKNYTVTVHYQTTGSPYRPVAREYAHGGVIGAAGGGPRSRMTLVGEQGPELVDLAPGSRVRSNPDTRRLMSGAGGGGGSAPMVVQVVLDGRVLASQLVDPMRAEIFGRGGNVQSVLGQRGA